MRLVDTRASDARADDLSGDAHRQLIGWIGLLVPALLVAIAIERDGLERWRSLESISAYYYTGAVAAFVGMLVALALFLLTYRGFGSPYQKADGALAITAVSRHWFFPTEAPARVAPLLVDAHQRRRPPRLRHRALRHVRALRAVALPHPSRRQDRNPRLAQ